MKKTIGKIALLLVISMLIGLVAGCDKATPAATTGAPGSTTAAPAATTTAASNINAPGQLPVVKEKVTIRLTIAANPYVLS